MDIIYDNIRKGKKKNYKRKSDCNYAMVAAEISKPFIERFPFNSTGRDIS